MREFTTTRFLWEEYTYGDAGCPTANQIFMELDDKWDMVERAKAYALANKLAEPTVLGDFLTFARAFADELELRGWVYRDLIHGEPEPLKETLAEYKEQETYAWKDASEIRKYVMDCLLTGAHVSDTDVGELGQSIDVDKDGMWVVKRGLE